MIRAAFPEDRPRSASMSPAATVSASPTATSDQSCAPLSALVLAIETVRGSRCRRSGDASSCRRGDPGFASRTRVAPVGFTDSDAAGPASAWMTVCWDDVIDGAVGSTVVGCTCGMSATPAVTGASANAGASAVVGCSVATGAGV